MGGYAGPDARARVVREKSPAAHGPGGCAGDRRGRAVGCPRSRDAGHATLRRDQDSRRSASLPARSLNLLRTLGQGEAERSPVFWTWASGITSLLVLGVFAAFHGLNFTHWDNTETFLPTIWYAHSQLLRGHFPFWN